MRPRQRPSAGLLDLARQQAGVLSTEQTDAYDLSRRSVERLVAEGTWRRMAHGLVFAGPDAPSWQARAWGGILLGGDRSRIGGWAAGHLWKLAKAPEEIVVLVGAKRTLGARHGWRFAREKPGLRLPSRGGPPRTTVEDTVIDMCQDLDESGVSDLITRTVQQGLSHPDRMTRRLEHFPKVRHRALLTDLLSDVADGAESPLELRYLNDVERAHDLPRGERQSRSGRAVHDVRYRAFGLVVELDGRLGHDGMGRFRDMRRDNITLVRGDATLRYGWTDVSGRPCVVAREVAAILTDRGWDGQPTSCPRCRQVPLSDFSVA